MAYLQAPKEGSEFAILFLDPIENENIQPCVGCGIAKKHDDHWQIYLNKGTTDNGKTNYGKSVQIHEYPITFSIYFQDRTKKGWDKVNNKSDPSKDQILKPSAFDLFICQQFDYDSDLAKGFTGSFRYSDASIQLLDILSSLDLQTDKAKYTQTLEKIWKIGLLSGEDTESDLFKSFAEQVEKQDALLVANAAKYGQKSGYKSQGEDERLKHRLAMLNTLTGLESPEAVANDLWPLGVDGNIIVTPMAKLAALLLN
jgi:hypothetical protein